MSKLIDLTGKRFGKWAVLNYAGYKNNLSYWNVVCDCGNTRTITSNSLRLGTSKSCGCITKGNRNKIGNKIRKYKDIAYLYDNHSNLKAIIDAEDVDLVKQYTWCFCKYNNGSHIYLQSTNSLHLHRLIMNAKPYDELVDHINHNTLDNRKCNLRIASQAQNLSNSGLRKSNTSGMKGVSWHKKTNKWQATISHKGKTKHIGLFCNIEDAADAYDRAAKELKGEYAFTNKDIKELRNDRK